MLFIKLPLQSFFASCNGGLVKSDYNNCLSRHNYSLYFGLVDLFVRIFGRDRIILEK
jgi:hypothetical protein